MCGTLRPSCEAPAPIHVTRVTSPPAAGIAPLDEKLPIDALELIDIDVFQLARFLDREDPIAQKALDLAAIALAGAADEGKFGEVAREPYAAADDDIAFRAGAPQPFAAGAY